MNEQFVGQQLVILQSYRCSSNEVLVTYHVAQGVTGVFLLIQRLFHPHHIYTGFLQNIFFTLHYVFSTSPCGGFSSPLKAVRHILEILIFFPVIAMLHYVTTLSTDFFLIWSIYVTCLALVLVKSLPGIILEVGNNSYSVNQV